MTQDKMRRVITACVSAATVLLVVLLGYLIYQWIAMANRDSKIEELETEIAEIEIMIDNAETQKDHYKSDFYLQWKLQEMGMLKDK